MLTTPVLSDDQSLNGKLQRAPAWLFVLFVSFTAFTIYASMYGFRKPFTAASYSGITLFHISYKVVLIISQVIGYMLGKFYGIRFIAGLQPARRPVILVRLILIAWSSLLLFGLVPMPYNFIFLFMNGFPLAMIWGLIFGYLEGRQVTEIMGAILSTSFIFASGLAKTVGKWLMLNLHISEHWMPFAAGGIFIFPLLIGTRLLSQTPPPSPQDVAARTIRKPMDREQRRNFIRRFGIALIPIIIAYIVLTILRDFSEDFANELWTETGYEKHAEIFAQTSTIVSLIVLAVIGGFFLIRNNYRAFQLNNVIIIFGFILAATATITFHLNIISPVTWIILADAGLYLAYVPYNCLYFERMLATYKEPGNVGFLIYLADAFGYLGTVVVLLVKEFFPIKYSWVDFFTWMFYFSAAIGIVLVFWSSSLFGIIYRKQNKT
jgi:MFS family permease